MSTIEVNPSSGGSGGGIATDPIWTAKGQLAAATGNATAVAVNVGLNGTVLTADSSAPAGVTWTVPAGSGDVVGPGSATDNALARFDGTTGKVIQNSVVIVTDGGNVSGLGTVSAGAITSSSLTASRALVSDGSKVIVSATTTATEIGFVNGVTSAIQTQIDGKQPLDATLTALAAYNTNGLLTQTAADTFVGRQVSVTVNTGLSVTNGNGVSGNPTLAGVGFSGDGGSGGTQGMVPAPAAGDAAAGKFLSADGAWETPAGSGDVVGPGSSTDNAIARFDSTTGQLIQNSVVIVDDSGNTSGLGTVASGAITPSNLSASRAVVSNGSKTLTSATTTAAEIDFVSGVTSGIQTQLNNKQPLDSTLTALAAYNTNGLLTQTAADTFTGRTATGTSNRLTITNGDGVSGNPTFDISSSYVGQASITTLGTIATGVWDGTDVAITAGGTGSSTAAGAVTNLGLDNTKIASVGITIDGGGSAITTGIKGDIFVPYACTINSVTMLADQSGSAVVDIWKVAYASYPATVSNTITASAKPTISSAAKSQDTTLTGWTTSVSAGDTIRFNVDSATTITRVTLVLKVTKT